MLKISCGDGPFQELAIPGGNFLPQPHRNLGKIFRSRFGHAFCRGKIFRRVIGPNPALIWMTTRVAEARQKNENRIVWTEYQPSAFVNSRPAP